MGGGVGDKHAAVYIAHSVNMFRATQAVVGVQPAVGLDGQSGRFRGQGRQGRLSADADQGGGRVQFLPVFTEDAPIPHVTAEVGVPRLNETESSLSGRLPQPPVTLGSEDHSQLRNIPLPIGEVSLTAEGEAHATVDVCFQREDPVSLLKHVHHFFGRLGAPLHARGRNVKVSVVRHKEQTIVLVPTRRDRV